MSVSSVGSAVSFNVIAAGQQPDLQQQKAQANAQADLLTALRGTNLPGNTFAKLRDGGGIDIYM
jgi:hypothetical protein